MAGKSEAADDLIAELAKLMAQDAQSDREAQPPGTSASPAQMVPVRIPGDSASKAAARAPTDFVQSYSASAGTASSHTANQEPVAPEASVSPPANDASSDPFHFDFDFGSEDHVASGLEDAPATSAEPAAADTSVTEPASPPADDAGLEHDSIADLISAELAADPAPQPQAFAPGAQPADARAEPGAGPAYMATSATVRAGADRGESLGSPRGDHDRFKVPPVFGLGSTAAKVAEPAAPVPPEPSTQVDWSVVPDAAPSTLPQPPAATVVAPAPVANHSGQMDPIDEIESLIGRAMSVEFDLPTDQTASPEPVAPVANARPVPSPALRSLATSDVSVDDTASMSAADQTIFAAAQATGAKLGWSSDAEIPDPESEPYAAAPRQRRGFGLGLSRAVAGPLVAVTLLLAAGFGLYWVLGLGSREAGPAPLLTADTTPIKEVAPVVTPDESASSQSVVFNEMDGVGVSVDEQLVSRDQSDVNEVTEVAAAVADISEEGLANRKVRTVKVRPDGTIVSGDDGVAGSAILPVDRPNVPAIPGAQTSSPDLLANIEPLEPTPAPDAQVSAFAAEPGSIVPAVDAAGNLIAGKSATIPLMRPAGLVLPDAQAVTQTLAAPAEAAASLAPVAPIAGATEVEALDNSAPAYVQLASQRSEADARQSAQNMVTRYGPLFGGANLEVQRVDLGVKGIYYRVRVPASSIEQANLICTNVKAAGGDCFTL